MKYIRSLYFSGENVKKVKNFQKYLKKFSTTDDTVQKGQLFNLVKVYKMACDKFRLKQRNHTCLNTFKFTFSVVGAQRVTKIIVKFQFLPGNLWYLSL